MGSTLSEVIEKSKELKKSVQELYRVLFNLRFYAKGCKDAPLLVICDELEFHLNKLLGAEVGE